LLLSTFPHEEIHWFVEAHDADATEASSQSLLLEASTVFALEVLDKSHPDGRRFYTYAPGAKTAEALPVGNTCAMCHNARGSLQGTFADDYPLTAHFARKP
jgi:hypothetical protein